MGSLSWTFGDVCPGLLKQGWIPYLGTPSFACNATPAKLLGGQHGNPIPILHTFSSTVRKPALDFD